MKSKNIKVTFVGRDLLHETYIGSKELDNVIQAFEKNAVMRFENGIIKTKFFHTMRFEEAI